MTETPKASVGRMVHYVSYGTPGGKYPMACRAAIITEAWPPGSFAPGSSEEHRATEVGLCVLTPTGMFFNQGTPCDLGSRIAPIPMTAYDKVPPALCGGRWYVGGTWHPAEVRGTDPRLARATDGVIPFAEVMEQRDGGQ